MIRRAFRVTPPAPRYRTLCRRRAWGGADDRRRQRSVVATSIDLAHPGSCVRTRRYPFEVEIVLPRAKRSDDQPIALVIWQGVALAERTMDEAYPPRRNRRVADLEQAS